MLWQGLLVLKVGFWVSPPLSVISCSIIDEQYTFPFGIYRELVAGALV